MMITELRISFTLACAIGMLCGLPAAYPARAMDEEPRDTAYDVEEDTAAGAPEVEAAVEPSAESEMPAPPSETEAPPQVEAETPPLTEAETLPLTETDATALPDAESPPPIETETPLLPEDETPLPMPEASPLPEPEASLLPEPEASTPSEPEASPLPAAEASPTSAVDAATTSNDAPPGDAEGPITAPTAPPAGSDTSLAPAATEEAAPPIADEDGVLPGLPNDAPGVALDTGPTGETVEQGVSEPPSGDSVTPGDFPTESEPPVVEIQPPDVQRSLFLLGTEVPPGAIDWLSWAASESFEGISTPTPVLVVNGTSPGPTLCLTAAVHGDELNGVEMVRRIMYSLDPKKLNGALIGVPIVNLHGFRRSSRYLPDRRDLNRYFPGSPTGSSAARIAYSFFHEVIVHCDELVDVHTGSFHRANLPQLRADLNIPEVVEMTEGFGATVVLHSAGARGTLRRAATDAGIPAVTLETGEPMRLQPKEVAHGVKGIETLLDKLGMVNKVSLWGDPQPVYYDARWIRANSGGILFSNVNLGERIRVGEVLGTVTDPITNKRTEIRSPYDGRIIGRALNQVVMPGFAAFHVGIRTSEEEVRADAAATTAETASPAQQSEAAPPVAGDAPPADVDSTQDEAEEFGFPEEEERPE